MQGRGWRLILEHHFNMEQLIDGEDALEHAGRYNPPAAIVGEENTFKVVYLSGSLRTAHQEMRGRADIRNHALVEFEYVLQGNAWIDLTDEVIQHEFGVTLSELYENWRSLNARNQLSTTQKIGMSIYADGRVEAIKVPSVRDDDGFNWVIFPDRFYAGSCINFIYSQKGSNSRDIDEESDSSSLDEADSDAYAEDERNNSLSEQRNIAEGLMGDSQF
ncbi:RES family NAD+ phosphorylase [Leptothoe spongobia]|uniref:RES family NAD+ phosphorylase n=1 Tax=Leptothoe spongobia TAU-MAC 1115 TaxID=1967444 RepID=A0A947DI67_9CYAN|nr:RES family NAD+ phosphorylase [Leptothoe spongobia]MBT9317647.1 RES family NAD+ phosphorylase [Leptothoe spongobia TAU-MAC 1115]